jgi:hypothetical protein
MCFCCIRNTACTPACTSSARGAGDTQCLAGAATGGIRQSEPGALIRGGNAGFGALGAGPLAVSGFAGPSAVDGTISFRCAR